MSYRNRILVALASLGFSVLAAAAPSIQSVAAVTPGAVRVELAGGEGKTLRLVEFDFWADAASPVAGENRLDPAVRRFGGGRSRTQAWRN